MTASLATHEAIIAALVGDASVTALVPAASILDRNSRPNPDPSIIVGEDQEVDDERIARDVTRVFSTLHIWKKEGGLRGVKTIAGAIRHAVRTARLRTVGGWYLSDCYVSGTRFLRDPDGETAHGIVTVESLLREVPT